jgi:hypothetical protein
MVLLPKVSSLAKLRGLQWKHDLKPMAYTTEVLVTLTKIERRCDFGVCLPGHVVYSCSNNIVNFFCLAQALRLFEPAQASSPHLIIMKPRANVVDILSNDTEALLDSLFSSLARDSPALHPCASFDADSFEN